VKQSGRLQKDSKAHRPKKPLNQKQLQHNIFLVAAYRKLTSQHINFNVAAWGQS
jgi:hypothetical protein